MAVTVDVVPPISRDPKDEIYPATAVAGGASFVMSEDKALLEIGSHEDVRIVDAATFLRMLAEGEPTDP